MSQHVAVMGRNGQLAHELQRSKPIDIDAIFCDRQLFDLARLKKKSFADFLAEQKITTVVNAAAYTAVDKAEEEEQLATQINAHAVQTMAEACADIGIRLIHVSTDFVFDGENTQPYTIDDRVNPQSAYGRSKALGEQYLFDALPGATCIRTGWVYSSHGNNFVKTMLRLMNERDSLNVVADQIGTPTWAYDLAQFIWHLVAQPCPGLLHYSNQGICSWYDFACAIQLLGQQKKRLTTACEISPIPAAQYPTPANRPAYSVLNKQAGMEKTGVTIQHWLHALEKMMNEL